MNIDNLEKDLLAYFQGSQVKTILQLVKKHDTTSTGGTGRAKAGSGSDKAATKPAAKRAKKATVSAKTNV